jgi:hypothetical protein
MTKRESICVECKYHFTEISNSGYDDCCNALAKEVKDYVTGEVNTIDVRDCYKVNIDGKCPDFDYVPKKKEVNGDIDFDI